MNKIIAYYNINNLYVIYMNVFFANYLNFRSLSMWLVISNGSTIKHSRIKLGGFFLKHSNLVGTQECFDLIPVVREISLKRTNHTKLSVTTFNSKPKPCIIYSFSFVFDFYENTLIYNIIRIF